MSGLFLQIDADQHFASRPEDVRVVGEKRNGGIGLEIAYRRAGKNPTRFPPAPGNGRQRKRAGVVGANGNDRHRRKILGQTDGGIAQVFARDVDRNIGRRPLERLKQDADLLAGAAAKLDHAAMRTHLSRDIARILFEDRDLGTGRIVFGQTADFLEQCRAARVIKELARNPLVGALEARQHRIPKAFFAGCQIMEGKARAIFHPRSSASRSPAKAQRADGGKKLR